MPLDCLLLSMEVRTYVLNSRDQQGKLWLSKTYIHTYEKQLCNIAFT